MKYSKNVISFCLYGDTATYITGMRENIILGKKYFKNWEIRIYYNCTVPIAYINEYKKMGAICILCKNLGNNLVNWEGMFWRWYPLDDDSVNCWISRDADSRLSEREFKIVNQWTKSQKTLHSIRDHRCHFNYIMGGLFGINNKFFKERYSFNKIDKIILDLSKYYKNRPYNVDQLFLNDNLWNILKGDVMAHISNGGRKVYDTDIEIPKSNDFIGKQYRLSDFKNNKKEKKGCYWKHSNNSVIFWSENPKAMNKDIIFKDDGEFFYHRYKNGFCQNWSDIKVIEDNNKKNINFEINELKTGCYWKRKNKSDIFYSLNKDNIREDIKFDSENEYYNHRVENGYPRNWSEIETLPENFVSKPELNKSIVKIDNENTNINKNLNMEKKENNKHKGCYWKRDNTSSIFYSLDKDNVKEDVRFNSPNQFFAHRIKNGYPKNWSQIKVLPSNYNLISNLDNDLVSIAISTYEANGKGHEFLKHSLEHIFLQDYKNIEIVISDHSSDNMIKELCENYKDKRYLIKYIHNPDKKGNSSHNTNNAMEHCSGKYIKILFMDDYLLNKTAVSKIVSKFKENPNKKWLVHSYKHTKNYKDLYNLHHPYFSHDIKLCNRIGCPSCLTIEQDVKDRFDENLKWFMDSDLYYRIFKKYGEPIFFHTPDTEIPLMINLHHDNQLSNTSCDRTLQERERKYIKEKKYDN